MNLVGIGFAPDRIHFELETKNRTTERITLVIRQGMQGSELAANLQACAESILQKEWPWTNRGKEKDPDGNVALKMVAEEAAEIIKGGC